MAWRKDNTLPALALSRVTHALARIFLDGAASVRRQGLARVYKAMG